MEATASRLVKNWEHSKIMRPTASATMTDNGLIARLLRSSSWVILGYGASQLFRLASNLILAKLLFPEAFGLMALISMITLGLILFSEVGIGPSIAQSKRGDDPDFLNTAWTIQVFRGFALWVIACLLAYPVSVFYAQPEILIYLPIAAFGMVINGLEPTRKETAHRHLQLGRLTALNLIAQFIGIVAMVVLALIWKSVAALVVGGLITALATLILFNRFLPGLKNSFRWEKSSVTELVTFGKWIFLSTLSSFFSSQGDKAILGKFLTLQSLGIYNIGFFLASFPLLLGQNLTGRVMIPVYRDMDGQDAEKVRRIRYGLTGGLMSLLTLMALAGPWIVGLLYDARYTASSAVVVAVSIAMMPAVIGMTYDQAALARGDSRRYFALNATRAVLQVGLLLIGVLNAGLIGALIGMGIAGLLSHLVVIWLARAHNVWDACHDAVFFFFWFSISALTYVWHAPMILELLAKVGRI
jgi:O-antigen/teichoic acid export membrane protein